MARIQNMVKTYVDTNLDQLHKNTKEAPLTGGQALDKELPNHIHRTPFFNVPTEIAQN